MTAGRSLAARLGGWSVRHRAIAIGGWLLVVIVTAWLGAAAGGDLAFSSDFNDQLRRSIARAEQQAG